MNRADGAKVVKSKLMVFERVWRSVSSDTKAPMEILDASPASPSPFATPRPTWIDLEFLRRGVNVGLFEELEKKYKNHLGMGYFASAQRSKKTRLAVAKEMPLFRTDFEGMPWPRELTHGISWLMSLSKFVKIKVESEDHKIILLTSILKPDKSRKYYSRSEEIWNYAKKHSYTAAHCFKEVMMDKTNLGNFSVNDIIWKHLCIRGVLQSKEFPNNELILWLDEELFIRPKYQHIPLTHFTENIGYEFPIIVQDTGSIPDMRAFFLRNIAVGQRMVWFWIIEIYMLIWCNRDECIANRNMEEMAFCSVYIDELVLVNAKNNDEVIDRMKMRHSLRRAIDSHMGKPYIFYENVISYFHESTSKLGVHRPFSTNGQNSPPVRFLGVMKEPSNAQENRKRRTRSDQVDHKVKPPMMWFFATTIGNVNQSFITTEAKFLTASTINSTED